MSASRTIYDAVVVGGGPAGATAAADLAASGRTVLLLDKAGRIKPCGGAIPPRLIRDFDIPDHLIVAKIKAARMVSPSAAEVDMPVDGGFVGMVDRDVFDEWLRVRAATEGATRATGTYERMRRTASGTVEVTYRPSGKSETGGGTGNGGDDADAPLTTITARAVIGADGALSRVGRDAIPGAKRMPYVFAYHEIIDTSAITGTGYDAARCDVYYQGHLSPDFYAWIFPHGPTASIGVGSAVKGFALRSAVAELRQATGLEGSATVRREGAPIPLKPLRRWDDGHNVVLAGDAAGVVAPASGEGIYYAMLGGRLAAGAVDAFLESGDARDLALARKRFMKDHGRVFMVLGLLQHFFYRNDRRRERFVSMCRDRDVQRLTWESYMNKELVRRDPMAHMRVFAKDVAHLFGFVSPR